MADPAHPGLQIDQHLSFQRRLFLVRRVGFVLLLAGLIATVLGLLGGTGPMAEGHARTGPVEADWPRFTRFQMPVRLDFAVETIVVEADTFDVVIAGDLARDFSFEDILPQPEEVALADDRVRYTFKVEPGTRQRVVIQGQPETIGRMRGTAAIAGQPPLRIDSFVYP
jgi:hypothetical protein